METVNLLIMHYDSFHNSANRFLHPPPQKYPDQRLSKGRGISGNSLWLWSPAFLLDVLIIPTAAGSSFAAYHVSVGHPTGA